MAKKKTTEKALNIDNILFNCRDYLRAARNSGSFFEKRDMMLTLVFLRFIGEKYEDGIENLKQTLKEQGLDPEDENIRAAFFDDATFADGTYNLPPEARWSTIISTPAPQLNVALDTALQRLEEEDPQLKGCFVKGTFTARNLAANDIKKIVDEVNKISHKTFGEEKDLIGRVYEYFLKEFAVNATKEEGEFYTPHDVVQLIAMMIEPYDGTLYDPCCGSGGMFIQSAELVKSKQGNLNGINVYGQEKEPATYRLAKMNLALRGISHNLGEEADSSFTHDLHKGLHFNYVLIEDDFKKFIADGNLDLTEDEVTQIYDTVRLVGAESDFATLHKVYNWLVDGIQFTPKDGIARMIPLINFEKDGVKNIFRVVNQFTVEYTNNGQKENRRPDVILFVNGMPLCIMELKNPADANATIYDAWEQINIRYWRDIPHLLHYCPLACISDGVKTRLGTVRTPYEHFYAWRRVNDGDAVSTLP